MSDYKSREEKDECFLYQQKLSLAAGLPSELYLLSNADTLLQVRNFFPRILNLSFEKAIINAIFLGLNLVLEFCN